MDFPSSWSLARLNAVCQLTDGLKTTGKQCLLDAKYLRGKSSGTIVEQGKLVYKGDNIMLVDGEELFYGLIIGIPPLQEQRIIVQKIEQLMQLLK